MKRILKHPLFAGGLVMVGGSMLGNVVNYVYHLLMGRMLGPINYGTLASLYSILYLISVVPSSASVAIVKFISSAKSKKETYEIYSSIKRSMFFLAFISSIVFFVVSPFIANFLHIDNSLMVSLLSIILFFSLITLVNQATSQGLLKFIGSVGPGLVSSIVKLALGLLFVFLGWSVFGAIVAVTIGIILAYIYSSRFIDKILEKKKIVKKFDIKPLLIYAFPVLLQALAFTSIFTTDVILVKHFFGSFEAGLYAALSTLGKIIFFAASPITATMFPIVSGRRSKGEAYQKIFFSALGVTLLMALSIVAFYWLFPNIAIGVLYGSAYLSAKAELVWMGMFILFYTLSYFLVNFSLSLGKTKIVILPLTVSLVQVFFIWFNHNSILEVIKISLTLTIILFLCLITYLGFNRIKAKIMR